MGISLDKVALWFATLNHMECVLVVELQAFYQLLYERLKYMEYSGDVESIRCLGGLLSNVIKLRDSSPVDFDHAYDACLHLHSELSHNDNYSISRYELTDHETALLSRVITLRDSIPVIRDRLFLDATGMLSKVLDTAGSKVSALLKSAAGNRVQEQRPEYIISYDVANNLLHLESGSERCAIPVDNTFVFKRVLSEFINTNGVRKVTGSVMESYRRFMSSPYGIHGEHPMMRWTDMWSCNKEDGFAIVYSTDKVKIMSSVRDGADGSFVWVYCAIVHVDNIIDNEMLVFPIEFVKKTLQNLEGTVDENGIIHGKLDNADEAMNNLKKSLYKIEYTASKNELMLRAGENTITINVDSNFDRFYFVRVISDSSIAHDFEMSSGRFCNNIIESILGNTSWVQVKYILYQNGFSLACNFMSSYGSIILYQIINAEDGCFVLLYCAQVAVAGNILVSSLLLFPMEEIDRIEKVWFETTNQMLRKPDSDWSL